MPRYVHIREFSDFHGVEVRLVETFIDQGLINCDPRDDGPYIAEQDIEPLEMMLRLHLELGLNPAGIETVLHMRERIRTLQERLRELEWQLKYLE